MQRLRKGCSAIFLNDRKEVLLCLRDDKPDIPEPGKWDLLGGQLEAAESPLSGIKREIREEIVIMNGDLGLVLHSLRLFKRYDFPDREEHVFWARLNLPVENLKLMEGQQLRWFSEAQVGRLQVAFGFDRVIREFFDSPPVSETTHS